MCSAMQQIQYNECILLIVLYEIQGVYESEQDVVKHGLRGLAEGPSGALSTIAFHIVLVDNLEILIQLSISIKTISKTLISIDQILIRNCLNVLATTMTRHIKLELIFFKACFLCALKGRNCNNNKKGAKSGNQSLKVL